MEFYGTLLPSRSGIDSLYFQKKEEKNTNVSQVKKFHILDLRTIKFIKRREKNYFRFSKLAEHLGCEAR